MIQRAWMASLVRSKDEARLALSLKNQVRESSKKGEEAAGTKGRGRLAYNLIYQNSALQLLNCISLHVYSLCRNSHTQKM